MFLLQSSLSSLAFSIVLEEEVGELLNFIAPTDTEFSLWTDGINALMGGVVGNNTAPFCQPGTGTILFKSIVNTV